MNISELIIFLAIGVLQGQLTGTFMKVRVMKVRVMKGRVMKGRGFSLLGDLVISTIGAVLGGFVLRF